MLFRSLMKILMVVMCGFVCVVFVSPSWAAEGPYISVEGGWSEGGVDLNDIVGGTALVGGAVGYRFNDHFRTDLSLGYRSAYPAGSVYRIAGMRLNWNSHLRALVGMANAYVDLVRLGRVTPYLGAGVGFARKKVDDIALADPQSGRTGTLSGTSQTGLAWQAGVGAGVDIAPGWVVDAGYRYVGLGEVASGDNLMVGGVPLPGKSVSGSLNAHEVHLGLRYQF